MRTAVSAVLDFNHLFIYFGGNRKFFFLTARRALRARLVHLQLIKIEPESNEWIN